MRRKPKYCQTKFSEHGFAYVFGKNAKHNEVQTLIGATKLNAKQIMHRVIKQVTLETPLAAWCSQGVLWV